MYPERLNGGEDFLLVASEGHAHSEEVSMETDEYRTRVRAKEYFKLVKYLCGVSYSVLSCETMSRLVNPACRKLCSYRSIFMARSHSETEPQAERGGGTRWSSRGWDVLGDRHR